MPELVLLDILGACALLIWGVRMVRTGISRAFGARLHHWLARSTGNTVFAFATGLATTFAMQSSTATAMIVAAFAGKELITTAMAQAVMLGANVSTSIAAKILALNLHWLASVLLIIGVTAFLSTDNSRRRALGRTAIGLGLMLLSLRLLASATEPMGHSPALALVMSLLERAPFLALVLGAAIAAIFASSLATVLVLMSLNATGVLSTDLAAWMVLGANVGGALPPFLTSLPLGPAAQRVTLGNLLVRGMGGLAMLPFIHPLLSWLNPISGSAGQAIINFHVIFNLLLAVVTLPLVQLIGRGLAWLLPVDPTETSTARHLDNASLSVPPLALACAAQEALTVAEMIEAMLQTGLKAFNSGDENRRAEMVKMDDQIDQLQNEIKLYLARLGREELTDEEERKRYEISLFVINMEHIGDIASTNIAHAIRRKNKRRLTLSDEGLDEISNLYGLVIEELKLARGLLVSSDRSIAQKLRDVDVEVKQYSRFSESSHLERLREGRTESVRTSSLHLDLLRDLKRISAHLTSVTHGH
ncbi:Na/Pi cotransporter family protein [Filomicrobium sp.]|uniref:Na/Pi cotransporter family protein n=1 Tax=Filomicrobium sp. TaxID=2024831 RepID=UPI002584DA3C|nr:Na/Pi cotransporter family protein [Filomicrobium sp.]MCV0370773.1 Na/Pi cotransporter family protein [Filomicrobium sp.]